MSNAPICEDCGHPISAHRRHGCRAWINEAGVPCGCEAWEVEELSESEASAQWHETANETEADSMLQQWLVLVHAELLANKRRERMAEDYFDSRAGTR